MYRDIFFDLDRTLIDFDQSSRSTIRELFFEYSETIPGDENSFNLFFETYSQVNLGLWDKYRKKEIGKEELNNKRFSNSFQISGLKCSDSTSFAKEYIKRSSNSVLLFPGTIETMDYLSKRYRLHVITNGFEEVQEGKLRLSGLGKYFDCIITSEKAGCMKPDRQIFDFALNCAKAKAEFSLMVGDDYDVDVRGASVAGIAQVLVTASPFNNNLERPTHTIKDIKELMRIL
jgi:putative hydrolase of the HAD superfamily